MHRLACGRYRDTLCPYLKRPLNVLQKVSIVFKSRLRFDLIPKDYHSSIYIHNLFLLIFCARHNILGALLGVPFLRNIPLGADDRNSIDRDYHIHNNNPLEAWVQVSQWKCAGHNACVLLSNTDQQRLLQQPGKPVQVLQ